jgi:hypothetical protein
MRWRGSGCEIEADNYDLLVFFENLIKNAQHIAVNVPHWRTEAVRDRNARVGRLQQDPLYVPQAASVMRCRWPCAASYHNRAKSFSAFPPPSYSTARICIVTR